MDAAKVIAKQAAEQSHGPIVELMIRHTRLLTAERSQSSPPWKEETRRRSPSVDRKTALYTVTYNVADLVMPLPVLPSRVDPSLPATKAKRTTPEPDFDSLIDLITSTVKPTTWDVIGGSGSIAPFKANLSLVVTQTREVHDEIVSLLEQLRRLQDIRIVLDTRVVVVSSDLIPKSPLDKENQDTARGLLQQSGPLPPECGVKLDFMQVRRLLKAVQKDGGKTNHCRVATMNGQVAAIALPNGPGDAQSVCVQAVVSSDRHHVRLTIVQDKKQGVSGSVGDGSTLAVELAPTETKNPTSRRLLLVTPKVIIAEEEEEKLGIEPTDNTK
jgi:hypothetical protein